MVKAGCERAAGKLDKVFAVGCGGVWVYSGMGVGLMLSEVGEDVNQGVANLAWAGQRTAVPAVCEEPAATTEQLVHVASDSNTEPAQPFHQSGAIVCFDQQVEVVGLNRKVDDANFAAAAAIGPRDGTTHGRKHELCTQRAAKTSQSDVYGVFAAMRGTLAMRKRRSARRCGSPRTCAPTTPARRKRQLQLD